MSDRTEKITEHQPDFESADLSCSESLDSYHSDSDVENSEVLSEFVQASRRYLQYSDHYRQLFEQFYDDARGGQVPKVYTDERAREEVVEEWIWKIMDHDMRHIAFYE